MWPGVGPTQRIVAVPSGNAEAGLKNNDPRIFLAQLLQGVIYLRESGYEEPSASVGNRFDNFKLVSPRSGIKRSAA